MPFTSGSVGVGAFSGIYTDAYPTIAYTNSQGVAVTTDVTAIKVDIKNSGLILDLNTPNGCPQGFLKVRGIRTFTIQAVVRVLASPTMAEVLAALAPPKDLSLITFAKFILTADTLMNGTCVYKTDGSLGLSDEGEAQISFECMRYFDGAGVEISAATLLTAVTPLA